jgi:hypothetical protein
MRTGIDIAECAAVSSPTYEAGVNRAYAIFEALLASSNVRGAAQGLARKKSTIARELALPNALNIQMTAFPVFS